MKVRKIIVSMILIIGLAVGNLYISPVEANTVEMKTSNTELKISLLNHKIDYRLNEVVFSIKNKSDKKIKITKVSIQKKVKGEWETLQPKKSETAKRKKYVTAKEKIYDSINLMEDYLISSEGLGNGKYAVYVKYKYNGKTLYKRKTFYIEGVKSESPSEEETTSSYGGDGEVGNAPLGRPDVEQNAVAGESDLVIKGPSIKVKLVNTDFSIDKKGKAKAMVFSEADYKKVKKTKIYISIQRKVKGKWKKYKSYKIVKNSNIAFFNKVVQLKKKGTYRMWVKISFYGEKKLRKQFKTKSKVQKY